MSVFVPAKQTQARAASLLLAQRVRDYFTGETHRREFEAWYQERHGTPYRWEKNTAKEKPPSV